MDEHCPHSGVKRTLPETVGMSAYDPKRFPLCADMMFGKDRAAITHAPNFFLAARRRLAVSRLSSL